MEKDLWRELGLNSETSQEQSSTPIIPIDRYTTSINRIRQFRWECQLCSEKRDN